MHRLPRPIDGAIRINLHVLRIPSVIIVVKVRIAGHGHTEFIIIGIDKNLSRPCIFLLPDSLTLFIGSKQRQEFIPIGQQTDIGAFHRLSRCRIDNDKTCFLLGQRLYQHTNVADITYRTGYLGSGLRFHLNHIDTLGQSRQCHRVLKNLAFFLAHILVRLTEWQQCQQRFHLTVTLCGTGIQFCISHRLDTIDTHRQLADISQSSHLEQHFLPRDVHSMFRRTREHWLRQRPLTITQLVHGLPRPPAVESKINILPLVFDGSRCVAIHITIVLYSCLTTLGQVLIDTDERVDTLQIVRFLQFHKSLRTLLNQRHQCCQESGMTVAFLAIVVMKRLILFQFVTDDTQQVVIEIAAVNTFHSQRFEVDGFGSSQLLTELRRQRNLLRRTLQVTIVFVDAAQHDLIDSLHGDIIFCLHTFFHTLNSRQQRIGRNLRHDTGALQLGLHQLPGLTLFLRLGDNLHQHVILGTGQIFLFRLFHLLPQRRISLSLCHHYACQHQRQRQHYFLHCRRFVKQFMQR